MVGQLNEKNNTCPVSSKCSIFYFLISFIFLSSLYSPLFASKIGRHGIVSMMTYNVENLFDAVDDGDLQKDVTFLPLKVKRKWGVNKCFGKERYYRRMCEELDWTQEKYEQKLRKIAQVLLGYNDGFGADIIVLEELENKRVIDDLWKKYLQRKGYLSPIHFESQSSRGIDIGIISRFPLTEPARVHPVDLSDTFNYPTREIIEARFQVDSQELRVAANHWPSQRNSLQARLKASSVLKEIAKEAEKDQVAFIAAGDFNTLPEENPNPISDNIADNVVDNSKRPLIDLQSFIGGFSNFPWGSYFYHGQWLFLDRFLMSKNLLRGAFTFKADLFSFEVFAPRYLFTEEYKKDPKTGERKTYLIPRRYDFFTGEGYSDHLPMVVKIVQS